MKYGRQSLTLLVALLIVATIFFSFSVSALGSYEKINNTVLVNDSYVYLSATPHTVHSSGWVYSNLTSKVYTGDADIVFGFDTSQTKPKAIELYKPHNITWNTSHQSDYLNVTSITTTTKPCDDGNEYNTYKRNATVYTCIDYFDDETCKQKGDYSRIVCFDSYQQQGNNYTVYWNTSHIEYRDWLDVSDTLTPLNYNYGGMNKWWYIKNVPITAGIDYQVRFYLRVPVSLTPASGKYWIAIKPSSETIQQAVGNSHLYSLDPWWNTSWSKCKNITITNPAPVSATLVDFPVYLNVSYDSDMQEDWDDIRFVNASCGTNDTEMSYEFVTNNSISAEVHVKLRKLRAGGENISMYYGNPTVASGNNTNDVWSNHFEYVEHFTNRTPAQFVDSAQNLIGNMTGNPSMRESIMGDALSCDGTDDMVNYGDKLDRNTYETTIEAFYNISSTASRRWLSKYEDNNNRYYFGIWTSQNFIAYSLDSTHTVWGFLTGAILTANHWDYETFVVNQTIDDTGYFYYNAKSYPLGTETSTQEYIENTGDFKICDYAGTKSAIQIDEVRISDTNRSSSWINATYMFYISQKDYVVWDAEQTSAPPADTTPPLIDVTAPVNNSYKSWSINITINGTSSDETALDVVWINDTRFDWNNTNSSWKFENNTAIGEEVVFLNISVNDTSDNRNSTYINFSIDRTPPDIDVTAPTNNTVNAMAHNVTINGTATDAHGDSIYVNDSRFTWNNTYTGWKLKNVSNIEQKVVFLTITANDSAGNTNTTYFNFSLDFTNPRITVTEPANNSYKTWSINITVNGTATDDNGDNIYTNDTRFDWNNSYGVWKLNNNTVVPEGIVFLNITADDRAGNQNSTYWNFTIDRSPPKFTVTYPINDSTHYDVERFNITGAASDINPSTIWTNNTLFDWNNTFTGWNFTNNSALANRVYLIKVSFNDSAGNENYTHVNFTLALSPDTEPPRIIVTEPVNNSYKSWSINVTINGTATDDRAVGYLWINDSRFTWNNTNASWKFMNNTLLPDGIYFLNISVNDSSGNQNSTYFNFTLDNTPPSITINEPVNNSYKSWKINATFNGTTDIPAVEINPDTIWTNNSDFTWNGTFDYWSFMNNTVIPDGVYFITIYANDSAGNQDVTYFNFTQDTTPPKITTTYPANDSSHTIKDNSNSMNLTGTATELYADSIWTNDSTFDTNLGTYSAWNFANRTAMTAKVYLINITLNDSAGNENYTHINFTMTLPADNDFPKIFVTAPTNNSYKSWAVNLTINGTASDETELGYIWINDSRFSWNGTNTTWKFKNISAVAEKVVFLNISVNDSSNNINSTYLNFTLDYTAPKISINYPSNDSEHTLKNSEVAMNITGTVIETNNGTLTINDSAFTWNGTYSAFNFTNTSALSTKVYFLNITANDSAGNSNITFWNFSITSPVVDTTPPKIFVSEPANNSYKSWKVNVTINGTSSDDTAVGYLWINDSRFTWNNTNASWKFQNNTVIPDNVVFLNISVNDSSGNQNSTYWNLTVDTKEPNIDITAPTNNSYKSWSVNVTFNGTATDNCTHTIYTNDTRFTWNSTTSSWKFQNNTVIGDGVVFVIIYANDSAGNTNQTYLNLTIDTSTPNFTIEYPINTSYYNYTGYSGFINISANETIYNCSLTPTAEAEWDYYDQDNNNLSFLNNSLNSQGLWLNMGISCWDYALNNYTQYISFTIDNTAPNFNMTDYNYSTNNNTLQVDLNISDGLSTYFNCTLYVDEILNDTFYRYNFFQLNSSVLDDGNYSLNVTCENQAGLISFDDSSWIFIDTSAPLISVTEPVNNSYKSWSINVTINGTASDLNNDSIYVNDSRFTWNGTYGSWSIYNNTNIADGVYFLEITANDSAGNTNTTYFNFTQDTTPPKITVTYPANDSSHTIATWFNITGTTIESNGDTIWTNDTTFATMGGTYASFNFTNTSAFTSGVYFVNITANDTVGNQNSTYWNFTIQTYDLCNPTVNVVLTNHQVCKTFNLSAGLEYDTAGYNLNVTQWAQINGTFQGRDYFHNMYNLTVFGTFNASSDVINVTDRIVFNGTFYNNTGTIITKYLIVDGGNVTTHNANISYINISRLSNYIVANHTHTTYVAPNTGNITILAGANLVFNDTADFHDAGIGDYSGWFLCQGSATDYAHVLAENEGGTNEWDFGSGAGGATAINIDLDYCEMKDLARFYPYGTNFTADNCNFTHFQNMIIRDIQVNLTDLTFTSFHYSAYKLYLYSDKVNIDGLYVYPSGQLQRFLRIGGGVHEIQNGNLNHGDTVCTTNGTAFIYNCTEYYWDEPTTYYAYANDSVSFSEADLEEITIVDGKTLYIAGGWHRNDGTGYEPNCGGTFNLTNDHLFSKIRISDGALDTNKNDVNLTINESFIVTSTADFIPSTTRPVFINDSTGVTFESNIRLQDVRVTDSSNLTITSRDVIFRNISMDATSYLKFHNNVTYNMSNITNTSPIEELTYASSDWIFNSTNFTNAGTYQTVVTVAGGLNQTVHPSVIVFDTAWNGHKYWMANSPYPDGDEEYENPSIYVCDTNCKEENGVWTAPAGFTNPIVDCNITGATCSDPELIYNSNLNRLELYYRWYNRLNLITGVTLRRTTSTDGVTWTASENCSNQLTSPSIYYNNSDSTYTLFGVNGSEYFRYNYAGSSYFQEWKSNDGLNFVLQETIRDEDLLIARSFWHPKVRWIPEYGEFWMLVSEAPHGSMAGGGGNQNLWFARKKDGVWTAYEDVALNTGVPNSWDDEIIYRTDFSYNHSNNTIYIWYTGRNDTTNNWNLGFTQAFVVEPLAVTPSANVTENVTEKEDDDFIFFCGDGYCCEICGENYYTCPQDCHLDFCKYPQSPLDVVLCWLYRTFGEKALNKYNNLMSILFGENAKQYRVTSVNKPERLEFCENPSSANDKLFCWSHEKLWKPLFNSIDYLYKLIYWEEEWEKKE